MLLFTHLHHEECLHLCLCLCYNTEKLRFKLILVSGGIFLLRFASINFDFYDVKFCNISMMHAEEWFSFYFPGPFWKRTNLNTSKVSHKKTAYSPKFYFKTDPIKSALKSSLNLDCQCRLFTRYSCKNVLKQATIIHLYFTIFFAATWLPHNQFWATVERTTSLIRC